MEYNQQNRNDLDYLQMQQLNEDLRIQREQGQRQRERLELLESENAQLREKQEAWRLRMRDSDQEHTAKLRLLDELQ